MLSDEHINYIARDIQFRGIVDDELGDELLDHICMLVEDRMSQGERFIEAYDKAIATFGNGSKLLQWQQQTIQYSNNNTKIMIKNYFKIAIRNLTKHKFYASINIAGLAIGVACTLLIYLFVANQLSYDDFHEHGDRTYRVVREGSINGTEFGFALAPAPLAFEARNELPEIEQACRFLNRGTYLVKTLEGKESFKETRLIFTDSTFFDMFSFPVLAGDPTSALARPKTIAISQSTAQKYFGEKDVIGKTLILDGEEHFEITAVYEDMPENSHLKFDLLMSMSSRDRADNRFYLTNNNFFTYFRLREGVNEKTFATKFLEFYGQKAEPELQQLMDFTIEEFKAAGNDINIWLQPMKDIYLGSDFTFDIGATGSREQVVLFIAIAIFILSLACINFMNLSTARSANRAKEVGIRKALGSYKIHLVRQFLTESIIMSILAFVLGLLLVIVTLPAFNNVAALQLQLPWNNPLFVASLILAAILIGVLAGVYPAFYLSSFRPVNTLKGRLSMGAGNSFIRSGLVVFQFCISILLIIGTIAIHKQLNFIQNKKIGFEKDQVLLVNDAYMLGDSRDAFKEEISKLSAVSSATYSGFIPVNGYYRNDNAFWQKELSPEENNMVSLQIWSVDHDYVATMGMELIDGRSFDHNIASDSSSVLLNEEAMRKFGFTDANGQPWIRTFDYNDSGEVLLDKFIDYKVIGVVENFHFESLKQNIGPLALRLGRSTGILSVRLNTPDIGNAIDDIKKVWTNTANGMPFSYNFLDDQFDKMYRNEQRLGQVFLIFSALAIFIGCLGLFALATFMAEQRVKEIGIRKVLGASVQSVVFMLSKQFTKLVVVAFIIATPIAWFGLEAWLDDYYYKIDIGYGIFIIAGAVACCIALLTVGYQAVKAALSNPVDALRSE